MSQFKVVWSLRELVALLRSRQLNKFDANFGVSGKRGDGKSTLVFDLLNALKKEGFNQKKHQVYTRKDVIHLLASQQFSFCWDDEAINSGYKRDFQAAGQKDLIKIVTNFRDNFNIYASALPFFYTLDKGLRELMFMHLHIIERGIAVILLPVMDQVHEQDPWDTIYNIKVEQKEHKRMQKDPKIKFRYHKFSTFAGYLYFGPMTKKQEEFYKAIKKEKRQKNFMDAGILAEKDVIPFKERIYKLLIEGKLTRNGLMQACLIEGEKFTSMQGALAVMLKNKGEYKKTVKDFLVSDVNETVHSKGKGSVMNLVPNFSS
jgi:hypothetical protein